MTSIPFPRWIPLMSCVALASAACQPAEAQLAISLDDQGGVSLQNGNQPPLVVGPGQSFGGTLTPNGFQGVMSDSQGKVRKMQPGVKNPFRDVKPATPRTPSQPLQINAGGISVSLPGSAAPLPPRMMMSEPLTPAQLAAVKHLVRTAEPMLALAEVDRMLLRSPAQADLLQMKAVLMMQQSRLRDAAACAYEATAQGSMWSWPMLRSCFTTREGAETLYRRLQKEISEKPTADRQFLLAWWERMLGHDKESVMALEQAMESLPSDALLARLHQDWSATVETDAPPAAQP